MTWLRRVADAALPEHHCDLPMRDVMVSLPRLPGLSSGVGWKPTAPSALTKVGVRPDGTVGDLWACDGCTAVWRIEPPERLGGRTRGGGYSPRGYDRWVRLSPRRAARALRQALLT